MARLLGIDEKLASPSTQENATLPLLSGSRTLSADALSAGAFAISMPSGPDQPDNNESESQSTSTDHHEHCRIPSGDFQQSVPDVSSSRESNLPQMSQSEAASSSGDGRQEASNSSSQERPNPINTGLWVSIESLFTVSQILAIAIVLLVSMEETPQAPLRLWVFGYAAACLTSLPLLYWRYKHRYVGIGSSGANESPERGVSSSQGRYNSSPPQQLALRDSMILQSSHLTQYEPLSPSSAQLHRQESGSANHRGGRWAELLETFADETRLSVLLERVKIALDCFFAVWFVVGNMWIFGGQATPADAPHLYRLCIVLLTLSCVAYAMPFILCATICCCLPCIIAVVGLVDEPGMHGKGAPPEAIAALPTYRFKAGPPPGGTSAAAASIRSSSGGGDDGGGSGGTGTQNERHVSGEDAVCCICLGHYREGVELRELPCWHHFHVSCVDTWLKINGCCPLCKVQIASGLPAAEEPASETRAADIGNDSAV
eukprot:jgi/Mesen1/750/ME000110S_11016